MFIYGYRNVVERRGRLPTEPGPGGHTSPLLSSPVKSPPPTMQEPQSDDASCKCNCIHYYFSLCIKIYTLI